LIFLFNRQLLTVYAIRTFYISTRQFLAERYTSLQPEYILLYESFRNGFVLIYQYREKEEGRMKRTVFLFISISSLVLLFAFAISADFYVVPVKNSSGGSIPSGMIAMWSGSIATIPDGWSLCNGSNGTPDLRSRFIVGAGSSYSVHSSGGQTTVTLSVSQMPGHNHGIWVSLGGLVPSEVTAGVQYPYGTDVGAVTLASGGGQAHENRPPYYALAYIMKL